MTNAVEKPESVGMSSRRLERIRPAMQSYVDRGVYAGLTTLIARRGKVVHAEQFGWRDKEAQSPMSADAIFRLYSMTKPIVCVGLMTLLEEARFTLLDPLAKYIPAFGKVKVLEPDGSLVGPTRPITLRDLMTHTSGLSYHFVESSPLSKMYHGAKLLDAGSSLETAVEDLARYPLAFHPGTRWRYSVGIDVVGRVIEVISGRPLGAFLRERLFEPLGMVDTGFEVPADKRGRLAAMYGRPDVIAPGPTMMSELEAWRNGVNDRLDVSRSYPVDSPEVFARGGHGLFATTGSRPQNPLPHAHEPPADDPPPSRHCRPALARLWLRSRLAGGARRRRNHGAGLGRRIRLVRCGKNPLLGRSSGAAGGAIHDPIDDELRPSGARPARAGLSGDRGLGDQVQRSGFCTPRL
jgi:CubicO group peptidase (beta-lactamase class C family)